MADSGGELVIVMARSEPDLDGVACAFAYAEFLAAEGVNARAWYPGEPDGEALFALAELSEPKFASSEEAHQAGTFILVDSSDLDGIPKTLEPLSFTEVIDHRFYTNAHTSFPVAKLQIEPVGAAATLIAERFIGRKSTPSRTSVALLYGAIHSNTLHLKGDLTTERDIAASTWLERSGLLPELWLDRQFAHRRAEIVADFAGYLKRERKAYLNPEIGRFEIVQLEFLGAAQVLQSEADCIRAMIVEHSAPIALNLVDIETSTSTFVTSHVQIQSRVSASLGVSFANHAAQFTPALLRKQMVVAINGER